MSQIYQDEKLSLIFQVQHRGMIQTKIYIKMLLGQSPAAALYSMCQPAGVDSKKLLFSWAAGRRH